MALVPVPGSRKALQPPIVIYRALDASRDNFQRRYIFYITEMFNEERMEHEMSLGDSWSDASIKNGDYLIFIEEADCPPTRQEERYRKIAEYDALSHEERVAWNRRTERE